MFIKKPSLKLGFLILASVPQLHRYAEEVAAAGHGIVVACLIEGVAQILDRII